MASNHANDFDLSRSSYPDDFNDPKTIIMNDQDGDESRTIDERMFLSQEQRHVTSDSGGLRLKSRRIISMLAEDESFAKANSESML